MRLFNRLAHFKWPLRGSTPARFLALLTTGSLAQRVTVAIGLGIFFFALFQSLPWFALAVAGLALCWLALRDFVRTHDR